MIGLDWSVSGFFLRISLMMNFGCIMVGRSVGALHSLPMMDGHWEDGLVLRDFFWGLYCFDG
jgi:hypothetical protein